MELTREHEQILALAEALSLETRRRQIDPALRDRLLALLDVHAAKEEAGLYPLLIAEMGGSADAFDHLEEEHRDIATDVTGDTFDHLALYALQRHIEEEEEVLFSGALFHFDGDTWDDLDAAHRAVERASAGPTAAVAS